MIKKLLALALALIPMLGFSQHRSESDAITIAQEFWGKGVNRAKLKAVSQKSMAKAKGRAMAKAASTTSGSKQSFYVINDEELNRFVIVSSDDRLIKILGYSDNGIFDAGTAPEGLLEMMNEYDGQYTAIYDDLSSVSTPKQATQCPIVQPLITSKWNQNAPYNNECPKNIKSYYGSNCVVGCVATAMAQIMNYWKYPECGNGSNTYTSSTQQIYQSMDFSTVHIDWSNILNDYNGDASDAQKSEVAKLNHAVGVSVSMDYGSTSWAYSSDAAYALVHFWNYNPNIAHKAKYQYTNEEWKQLILDELTAGHPLYYRGSGWAGGHAFILDGCNDEGLYHFNFGWAGNCDGYYALEAISTYNGNFTSGQDMVCYITPQEYGPKNLRIYCYSGLDPHALKVGDKEYFMQSVEYEEGVRTVNIVVTDKLTFNGEIGIGLFDKDFQFVKSLLKKDTEIENYSYDRISDWITFDAQTFSEGKQYYIAGYVYSEEMGYKIVETSKHEKDYYLVTVKNGEITFEPMKLMGNQETVINEVVTGLYNVTAMNATGDNENWQIQMWQDESDVSKYWIGNLDPKAKAKGSGYDEGWNKVYGYINEAGNKLCIPVGQSIGKNLLLHNYSGGDAIDVYLTASNKTMNIESAWGCQEVDYSTGNATAKEFSRYEGGYFVFTTEKENEPVDVEVSSPLISLSSTHILSLSCNTDGAMLYYSLDGTQPSASSIAYNAPVEIMGNCTIKAIAMKDSKYSGISSYTISDFVCEAPVISQILNSNSVTISSGTVDVNIYYTIDGRTPTKNSTLYTSAFDIDKSCIVNAIAIKEGYKDSPVATQSVIYYSPAPNLDNEVVVSDNVAGELASHVSSSDKANATRWTISGEINGTDIAFIREVFDNGKITDLNLGNAIIVSGGEPYYKTSYSEYNTENNVVGTNMFYKAKSLISLVLPSTIQKIKSYSIQDCDNLASITIPELCMEVESSGIYNNKNLSSIHIGKSLEKFESMNGNMCPALRSITVDANNNNFESVDGVLYSKNMDIIYKYPAGKTESSFEMPSSLKVIGNYAFSHTSLESIKMPNGLESINSGAFDGCKDLLSVEIPQSVKEIGTFAFQNCAKITNVVVPDNVKELNSYAFGYCINLRDINIGASINEIEGSAFTGCTSLQSFIVSKDNNTYTSEGGILYSKDLTRLVRCPLALYSDEMILDDGVFVIESNAFQNCKYIKKFRLPDGLKTIGSFAFDKCTMEAISVPNSVEKIGSYAFQNCTNLKNFAVPTSTSDVPSFMLAGCDSLEYLYIHKDVSHIDSYAFTRAKKLNTVECWIDDIDHLPVSDYYGEYTPFYDIKSDCTWHIPEGCADAYKSQPWWISTWNIVDDLRNSTNGIASIINDTDVKLIPGEHAVDITSPTDKTINIYNLQGNLVNSVKAKAGQTTTVPLQSGVYVINRNKIRIK